VLRRGASTRVNRTPLLRAVSRRQILPSCRVMQAPFLSGNNRSLQCLRIWPAVAADDSGPCPTALMRMIPALGWDESHP